MNRNIFEDMKQRLGCKEISDLPYQKRAVWEMVKALPPESYPSEQLEDFSRYVFGVKFSILTEVMGLRKGRDET
ncbi:hypothetical protein [Blautia producta]|uniref:hypothetical protein n=1 Tax=Blautia producta TaxID=33035 RepID=UPI0031B6220A